MLFRSGDYKYYYGLESAQSSRLVTEYSEAGFAYVDYPSQIQYGMSIASPSWVSSLIEKRSKLQLYSVIEKGWDSHQDVYIFSHKRNPALEMMKEYESILRPFLLSKLEEKLLMTSPIEKIKTEIDQWIEQKVNEDKMPFGPRLRQLLRDYLLSRLYPG